MSYVYLVNENVVADGSPTIDEIVFHVQRYLETVSHYAPRILLDFHRNVPFAHNSSTKSLVSATRKQLNKLDPMFGAAFCAQFRVFDPNYN